MRVCVCVCTCVYAVVPSAPFFILFPLEAACHVLLDGEIHQLNAGPHIFQEVGTRLLPLTNASFFCDVAPPPPRTLHINDKHFRFLIMTFADARACNWVDRTILYATRDLVIHTVHHQDCDVV